jgi:thiamine-monophosphate kinase
MKRALKNAGELGVIAQIRARAGKPRGGVRLGIGDDCAVLRVRSGEDLLVTTDFSLEGRHFRRDWHPARSAGWRAVVRGLSDLAAMGATPAGAFLSLAVPRGQADSVYLKGFLDGVFAGLKAADTQLCGGDTAESPDGLYLADIVLVGHTPAGKALLRSGARVGDKLYCTGCLGGSAAELQTLAASPLRFRSAKPTGDHPHLFPHARLKVGVALRQRKLASACMDLSDGLSSDLAQMCEASGVAAEVDAARLPLHPLAAALHPSAAALGAEQEAGGLRAALHGGEDYELLFTAPQRVKMPRSLGGVAVSEIGRIVERRKGRPQVMLVSADGRRKPLERGGWEHLR